MEKSEKNMSEMLRKMSKFVPETNRRDVPINSNLECCARELYYIYEGRK